MTKVLKFLVVIFLVSTRLKVKCCAENISSKFLLQQDSKLPKLICDAVKGTVANDKHINTASISIFENNLEPSIIDETVKCLPKSLSVTTTDFRTQRVRTENSRKSSIEIIIADEIDMVRNLIISKV